MRSTFVSYNVFSLSPTLRAFSWGLWHSVFSHPPSGIALITSPLSTSESKLEHSVDCPLSVPLQSESDVTRLRVGLMAIGLLADNAPPPLYRLL